MKVSWLALPTVADKGLIPLDAASSLTAAPLGEGAVLPAGRLTRQARFGSGETAAKWLDSLPDGVALLGQQSAFVSPGTTVRFDAAELSSQPFISIAVAREADGSRAASAPATSPGRPVDASLAVSIGLPASADPAVAQAAETAFVQHQKLSPELPYVLIFPALSNNGYKATAAFIEVLPTNADAAEQAAWEKAAASASQSSQPAPPLSQQVAMQRALEALAGDGDPRPALIYLSASTQARITADVALMADRTLLGKMREAVKASDTESIDAVAWVLEKTTLLTLADAANKSPLPAEMQAVLAVHTGEVGRHPDLLAEIAGMVGSRNALQERLIGENFIALEDNSASARVRAFDWLRAQGKAPADFDPLGPPRARRAALNRALNPVGGTP